MGRKLNRQLLYKHFILCLPTNNNRRVNLVTRNSCFPIKEHTVKHCWSKFEDLRFKENAPEFLILCTIKTTKYWRSKPSIYHKIIKIFKIPIAISKSVGINQCDTCCSLTRCSSISFYWELDSFLFCCPCLIIYESVESTVNPFLQ